MAKFVKLVLYDGGLVWVNMDLIVDIRPWEFHSTKLTSIPPGGPSGPYSIIVKEQAAAIAALAHGANPDIVALRDEEADGF